MTNDAPVRIDLNRFADDGCPHISGDTHTHEVPELWDSFDEDIGETSFALAFDSGGEG